MNTELMNLYTRQHSLERQLESKRNNDIELEEELEEVTCKIEYLERRSMEGKLDVQTLYPTIMMTGSKEKLNAKYGKGGMHCGTNVKKH